MLSPKVDLTEHSDFGPEIQEYHNELFGGSKRYRTSVGPPDAWSWWHFFGPDSCYEELTIDGSVPLFSIGRYIPKRWCSFCGKEMSRIPWNIVQGICRDCHDNGPHFTSTSNKSKIPWMKQSKRYTSSDVLRMR